MKKIWKLLKTKIPSIKKVLTNILLCWDYYKFYIEKWANKVNNYEENR